MHTLNPVISDPIIAAARTHRAVITVEEHTIHGGLAGLVLEQMADAGQFPTRFLRIGLQGCFSSIVGSQAYLRAHYGMDANTIVHRIRELIT
jgi:transketolase